jgi:hypothetical protein
MIGIRSGCIAKPKPTGQRADVEFFFCVRLPELVRESFHSDTLDRLHHLLRGEVMHHMSRTLNDLGYAFRNGAYKTFHIPSRWATSGARLLRPAYDE